MRASAQPTSRDDLPLSSTSITRKRLEQNGGTDNDILLLLRSRVAGPRLTQSEERTLCHAVMGCETRGATCRRATQHARKQSKTSIEKHALR